MNIKDVAKLAGVSISTISRVINNSAYVSPEVRERIERVLAETGYRPNSLAKELLRKKTDTIGVMLPRIDLITFADTIDGIAEVLNRSSYNIMLANTRDNLEDEIRYLKLFHEKRVDGVLYFATAITDRHVELVKKMHMPIVIVGQSGHAFNLPSVRMDNFNAAQAMVRELVRQGHRRIGCLTAPDHDINVATLRKEGYKAALREAGIPINERLIVTRDFEYSSGAAGAARLMQLPPTERPTAVFCITDRLAVAACAWLNRHGFEVPGRVSVACVDDPAILSHTFPSVTTMAFDYLETGRLAARMIMDCISGACPEPAELVMPYTLQLRESTRSLEERN